MRILESDLRALRLLSRCPLLWPTGLGRLAGLGGPSASRARVLALRRAGLVGQAHLPVRPGREGARLYPTDAGLAVLAGVLGEAPRRLARRLGLRGADLRALLPGLPHRLDCYRLLCALASLHPGIPEVLEFRCPWIERFQRATGRSPLRVRLPAYAALVWPGARGAYVLLPDRGVFPPRAFRAALAALVAMARGGAAAPPLFIATTDAHRAAGWRRLLAEVGGDLAATARVRTWRDLDREPRACPEPPVPPRYVTVTPAGARRPRVVGAPFRDPPPPRSRSDGLGQLALRLSPADRRLLDEIGPRPYRPDAQLAAELGWCTRWVRARRNWLLRLGVVGLVHRAPDREGPALALPELCQEGLAIGAAQHGLTPAQAVRFGGYVARPGGASTFPPGAPRGRVRAQLLGPLAHTLAVDAFVAGLLEGARERRRLGWDDRLLVWRPAAVCARGRMRPDGYGLYRRDGARYGFLLELDRATAGASDYWEKFRAYYEYLETGAYERDYGTFPTVLVVTTTYAAERLIAAILRALARGRTPLPVLLTTTDLIAGHGDGALGPVWREPAAEPADGGARPSRRAWLLPPGSDRHEGHRDATARQKHSELPADRVLAQLHEAARGHGGC